MRLDCLFNFRGKGFTMFSVATFLDRVKAGANIDSDYRLAKVIGITHAAISGYRHGKSLPNESAIEKLCALSGDDPDFIAAQIQAARAQNEPARVMWNRIAMRLAGGASTAFLSVLFSLVLIAGTARDALAGEAPTAKLSAVQIIYIVSSTFLSVARRWLVRLRHIGHYFPVCLACFTIT